MDGDKAAIVRDGPPTFPHSPSFERRIWKLLGENDNGYPDEEHDENNAHMMIMTRASHDETGQQFNDDETDLQGGKNGLHGVVAAPAVVAAHRQGRGSAGGEGCWLLL